MPDSNYEDEFAPTVWGGPTGDPLTMPSGQRALVRRPGVQGLIQAGVLHSLDSLSAIVEGLIRKAEGAPEIDASKLMQKPEQVEQMMHIIDRVVCHVVLKPTVVMAPNDQTNRKDGVVYTDMIELEDKMFIFNYAVGGVKDIESFRAQSKAALGDLDGFSESSVPSE